MLARFSSTFVAGLFASLPLVITIGLIMFLVSLVNGWIGPASPLGNLLQLISRDNTWVMVGCYVASLIIVILLIWFVGYLATRVAGKRIGRLFTGVIGRVPFVNKVYSSVEQVIGLMRQSGQEDSAMKLANVVFFRYCNTIIVGMLASAETIEINGVAHVMVYYPSSPIPATGMIYLVPVTDVFDADVSVEDMTKIYLSMGYLASSILNAKQPIAVPLGSLKPE